MFGQGKCPFDFFLDVSANANAYMQGDLTAFDADDDGLACYEEYPIGTDPRKADTNGDGISDKVSQQMGIDPLTDDVDMDGVKNRDELLQGTDPLFTDSDHDGVADGADAYPTDPSASTKPPKNPADVTPPIITILRPVNAVAVP
jgi:hypothetical protein